MKKLTGILMAVCLASSLIAGCGQKAGGQNTQTTNGQSAAQTESQTTGNPSETGNGNGEEKSAAQHCILPVSYTHLDVYKRQEKWSALEGGLTIVKTWRKH